jgi:squalene-associated FAD-dependent desaturase
MASLAVIGAGWAGLASAVAGVQSGHAVTVYEAARTLGGRARSLAVDLPDGTAATLDNGQHILVGAYTHTLALMQTVGVAPTQVLHAMPLSLRLPDGQGLHLPAWRAPLDAAWGIATARGWGWADKASLLGHTLRWRRAGFSCAPTLTVAALCASLAPRVMQQLIEPLCVAALNTPAERASAQVFLRVLRDSLFGGGWGQWGGSWLLLPRAPLGALLPDAAAQWLARQGASLRVGQRVRSLQRDDALPDTPWRVECEAFDHVVLATPAGEAARLVESAQLAGEAFSAPAQALQHEAITTVYATGGPRLAEPMLALRSGPDAPAQFVFDRAQLGGPPGLLAFVASASEGGRETIEAQVLAQARALGWHGLQPLTTVVEKRATFACTPGLARPPARIAPGLWACGDYVEGPYPATLEGAVRSAQQVVAAIG